MDKTILATMIKAVKAGTMALADLPPAYRLAVEEVINKEVVE